MRHTPDDPRIRHAERTGYAPWEKPLFSECPYCHGAQGDWVFILDGEPVCQDCFLDWVKENAAANPHEVATALAVTVQYVG